MESPIFVVRLLIPGTGIMSRFLAFISSCHQKRLFWARTAVWQFLLHSLSYSKQPVYVTPKITDNYAKVVLITDDTSNTVTNSNHEGLQTALNKALSDIISWFKVNLQSLNCNKTLFTILN